jgi:hypothetical protein
MIIRRVPFLVKSFGHPRQRAADRNAEKVPFASRCTQGCLFCVSVGLLLQLLLLAGTGDPILFFFQNSFYFSKIYFRFGTRRFELKIVRILARVDFQKFDQRIWHASKNFWFGLRLQTTAAKVLCLSARIQFNFEKHSCQNLNFHSNRLVPKF